MKINAFLYSDRNFVTCVILVITIVFFQCNGAQQDSSTSVQKLNHLQVIGSHNSYKQAIQPELLKYATEQDPEVAGLAYSHLPITEQLDLGLRIIEIDIYHDPEGGKYKEPIGNKLLQSQGIDVLPYDEKSVLEEPGFKVFHVQDIDYRSHCLLLINCLTEIKHWSDKNPDHLPLVITVNTKSDTLSLPESILPLPFTENVFDQLDDVFLTALGKENIISPTRLQGNRPTLNEAILRDGWPSLQSCRGKFLIVLDEPMKKIDTYLSASRNQRGIMFTNAPAGHKSSAFIVSNDPISDEELIKKYVIDGYLVRTRADADTQEALKNDYSRFEAAKRSGAQFISTDYYYNSMEHPNFKIQFEDGSYVRCNPILNQSNCSLQF